MKKIGLWKKIASWLLVFLLVLQIPVDTFAEEWISGNDISVETDFTENENSNNEEEENTDFYSDGNIEESEGDSLFQMNCQRQILFLLVMEPVCPKIQRHRKFRLL